MNRPTDRKPPPNLGKADLRAWVRAHRRELPNPLTQAINEGIATTVLGDGMVQRALSARPSAPVLVYAEAPGEPPTGALRAQLRRTGTNVFAPWALPDRTMSWLPDSDGTRAWGLPGIGAPPHSAAALTTAELLRQQPSLVILPALAGASAGQRLGQGGGYYDTLLAGCATWSDGGPLRVALVWPWEVLDDLPADPHDQPVDLVVSYWPR